MSSVTVRGTALASVTPDRAHVSLALSHLAADAATALDEVAERSQQLESLLAGLEFEKADWVTEGVQVAEEYQWKNDTNVLVGHRASTAVTVTVRSLDLVGKVIRDGVTTAGASVRSLVWRVDADNPAHRRLLSEAALDARLRAQAYVEALGLRLGEVELISEAPIAAEPTPGPQPREMMMAKMAGSDSAELSVSGGLVELNAEVHVRFAILP
ncbi:MAG: SIMPL domain-containing protein [Actinomycetota bacterium]|nr:SIMPL domain-containing protein [Actinomycetota bacterium]